MLPLLRADLFKLHKSWIVWMLWSIMLLFVIGYMLLEVLVEPSRVAFLFPTDMLTVGIIMQGLGIFLLIFFCAQVVGNEFAYDTWKNLLPRHPGRVGFILSKWLTFMFAIVAGSVALLGTVIGRSTVIGIIIGFVWFIADIALRQLLPQAWQVVTFTTASGSLQAYAMGTETSYALLPDLLVTVAYLLLPIVLAAYVFRQRDILGPA
jgi:ABC-type transport system involved in multi-copper enzyme maturation permease subunit